MRNMAEFSVFFNACVGVVVMDALEIFGFNLVPCHVRMLIQAHRHIPHQIFHKNRILKCALGYVFFIRPFEQGIQLAAGRGFNQLDNVLNPNRITASELHGHLTALVVCALFADGFGAGAQGGDMNAHLEQKIDLLAVGSGIKPGAIVHQPRFARDRCGFFQEKRKIHFQMRRLRIELILHGGEDVRNIFDVHHVAVCVEHLKEAAHVGALEVLWQIYKHPNGGDGFLMRMGLVANADRETQVSNAHLVDTQLTMVAFLLNICQRCLIIDFNLSGGKHSTLQ